MFYCFLNEDIQGLTQDPLNIQKEYAQRIGYLCVGDLEKQTLFVAPGYDLTRADEKMLLRCSYDNLKAGLRLLEMHGANLVETESDIEQIESWHTFGLTSRPIREVSLSELLMASPDTLGAPDKIFLKSKHKGFSAIIDTSRIVRRDPEVVSFLETQCGKYGTQIIVSKYVPIKTDSIGTRETRHIILDGCLANSSRFLHTVKHTVPRSHRVKAQELVHQIKALGTFPSNYVLDLGEFIDDDGTPYLDIVELNPLSCSMCYVNNSIFDVTVPEINELQKTLMMGYEYCYDATRNPQRYMQERSSNRSYVFTSEERYYFFEAKK